MKSHLHSKAAPELYTRFLGLFSVGFELLYSLHQCFFFFLFFYLLSEKGPGHNGDVAISKKEKKLNIGDEHH